MMTTVTVNGFSTYIFKPVYKTFFGFFFFVGVDKVRIRWITQHYQETKQEEIPAENLMHI